MYFSLNTIADAREPEIRWKLPNSCPTSEFEGHHSPFTMASRSKGALCGLVSALLITDVLTIIGDRPLARTSDFSSGGDLRAATLNEELDSLTIMSQQLNEAFDRTNKPLRKSRTMPSEKGGSGNTIDEECGRKEESISYGANLDLEQQQRQAIEAFATNPVAPLSEQAVHRLTTFAIILVCYIAAVLAPGVAIVWDIAGSSMAFLIQFILPALCYIRLKVRAGASSRSNNLIWAHILLCFGTVTAILCTVQTVWRLAYK